MGSNLCSDPEIWQWSGNAHVMEQSLLHTISPGNEAHIVTNFLSPGEVRSHGRGL